MKRLFCMTALLALGVFLVFAGGGRQRGESQGTGSGGFVSAAATNMERLTEKYPNPVTIATVLGYRESENPDTPKNVTPETQPKIKAFKDLFNIDFKYSWIVNSDQYNQKFAAELAAGNLPDIMMISPNEFEDLYSQGGLADLTDAWAKYSTPEMERIYNAYNVGLGAATRNGKLYGLPNLTFNGQETSQTYYNMTKLKAYGVNSYKDLPKTIAEFEALCDKILALNPGQPVLPACKQLSGQGLADFQPILDAYGASISGYVDYGTGNLEYAGTHPNLKKALTKLNEWYRKGYFVRDFAGIDVWGANSPVINDIVAGRYAIVFGSWWIPNWPLNMNKNTDPAADWVVGPTLTESGGQPVVTINRYAVNNFIVVSRNCKNPEALFKMIHYDIENTKKLLDPDYLAGRTADQKRIDDSDVYIWFPWRTYDPTSLEVNYEFFHDLEERGITGRDKFPFGETPQNNEASGVTQAFLDYHGGKTADGAVWGLYTSRVAPNGGVAKMLELYNSAKRYYKEVYITTPSMVTKSGPLGEYQSAQLLRMIMGEIPVSDFEKYAAQYNTLGGSDILREVNDWYHKK
ncbi:MAG: extracellular solute-binding protein [Treponema sp.]|jgi:ABC-type glycerol-3-phosphate transport system substrate-binding protein|nr:extracellular solute-binding protein [Treponema sp.]